MLLLQWSVALSVLVLQEREAGETLSLLSGSKREGTGAPSATTGSEPVKNCAGVDFHCQKAKRMAVAQRKST